MKILGIFSLFILISATAFAGGSSIGQGSVELRQQHDNPEGYHYPSAANAETTKFWKVVSLSTKKTSVNFAIAELIDGAWSVHTKSVDASKVSEAALLRIQSGDQSVYQWNKSK